MKLTKFSDVAKGPMFDNKDIMGLGESHHDDEHWVDNKEIEVKYKMDSGANNIIDKNFQFKNKVFAHNERVKNSRNDYYSRTHIDKDKIFGNNMFSNNNFNKVKNIFGDKKMTNNNYGNKVNQLLGKGLDKGNWLTGKTQKINVKDKSNMLFGMKNNINMLDKSNMLFGMKSNINSRSKIDEFLGRQNLRGAKNSERKARSHMIQNPFGMAKGRINMQKKLSMLGDYDGDGLANILDCNPMDKNKQALFHDWFKKKEPNIEKTERDLIIETRAREEAQQLSRQELEQPIIERDIEKLKSLGLAFKTGVERVGAGLGRFGEGVKTGRDLIIETRAREEAQQLSRQELEQPIIERDIEKLKSLGLAVKTGVERVGAGLGRFGEELKTGTYNVGRGLGIILTPEERLAQNKLKFEREKALLPLKLQQARVEQERIKLGIAEKPISTLRAPGAALSTAQQALGATPMFSSRGPSGYPQMPGIDHSIAKIYQMSQLGGSPRGGFEQTVMQLGGQPAIDLPSSVSLPPPSYGQQQPSYGQPSYSQPQTAFQPVASQSGYESTGEKIVDGVRYIRTPDGRWKNTKTGDTINYPRGSYKKSQKVVYVQQPQY